MVGDYQWVFVLGRYGRTLGFLRQGKMFGFDTMREGTKEFGQKTVVVGLAEGRGHWSRTPNT